MCPTFRGGGKEGLRSQGAFCTQRDLTAVWQVVGLYTV